MRGEGGVRINLCSENLSRGLLKDAEAVSDGTESIYPGQIKRPFVPRSDRELCI
jgi:hypothetical protein